MADGNITRDRFVRRKRRAKPKHFSRVLLGGYCAGCGVEIVGTASRLHPAVEGRYCSRTCFISKVSSPIEKQRACSHCSKSYVKKKGRASSEGNKFCSRECFFEAQKKRFEAARSERTASKLRLQNARRFILECKKTTRATTPQRRTCCHCGSIFDWARVKSRPSAYCSDDCRLAGRKAKVTAWKRSPPGRAMDRSLKSARRLRGAGVFPPLIDPDKVLHRDEYRCRMCKRTLDRKDRGTTSWLAPEVDHYIPLALGGVHQEWNMQCLCRRCNIMKGEGFIFGYLPPPGWNEHQQVAAPLWESMLDWLYSDVGQKWSQRRAAVIDRMKLL